MRLRGKSTRPVNYEGVDDDDDDDDDDDEEEEEEEDGNSSEKGEDACNAHERLTRRCVRKIQRFPLLGYPFSQFLNSNLLF